MIHGDCTNTRKPCHLHDEHDDWHIPFRGRQVHTGWFIAALIVVIAVSTVPGLN